VPGRETVTPLDKTLAATGGIAAYVPYARLWSTATLLADTLPLDRPPTYPRALRQLGHWFRLLLWDRAITNPEGTAIMVIGGTPWLVAGGAAVGAALVAPRLASWHRRVLFGLVAVFALRGNRLRDEIALRRQLRTVAPAGLMIEELVAVSPGAALPWVTSVLSTLDEAGHDATFVAILPGARRDRVRERIYSRRWGFEVVTRAVVRGRAYTVLVRRRPTP